jgi:hypothetical protein
MRTVNPKTWVRSVGNGNGNGRPCCITPARGLELFCFPVAKTTTSFPTRNITKKSYNMADITGPPMNYSSMKGRLHDGLLKGLEVMGYE